MKALGEGYEELLDHYVKDLRLAKADAAARHEGRMKTWTKRLGSEARASEKLARNPPLCTGKRVVAVVRKYWLACDALNRRHPEQAIEPPDFLVSFLRRKDPSLALFISEMPYWPIGKDNEGNWV